MTDLRWQRLGLAQDNCDLRIEELVEALDTWGRYNDVYGAVSADNPTYESFTGRQRDLIICYEQIQLAHLQFPAPFAPVSETVAIASQLAVDLFCGAWRERALLHSGKVLNSNECRIHNDQWFDEYRIALVVTLLNRDEFHVVAVADYIGDDLYPDEGAWNRTKEDRMFYTILKGFICKQQVDEELSQRILASRAKRPKLLLELLTSIATADLRRFEEAFLQLVKQFKARELTDMARYVTSIDASLIWNLAMQRGLSPTLQDIGTMDRVITRESIGLT